MTRTQHLKNLAMSGGQHPAPSVQKNTGGPRRRGAPEGPQPRWGVHEGGERRSRTAPTPKRTPPAPHGGPGEGKPRRARQPRRGTHEGSKGRSQTAPRAPKGIPRAPTTGGKVTFTCGVKQRRRRRVQPGGLPIQTRSPAFPSDAPVAPPGHIREDTEIRQERRRRELAVDAGPECRFDAANPPRCRGT